MANISCNITELKQYRSKKMVTEIRQLAAKAQIEEAMNGTGLTYLILPLRIWRDA